MPDVIVPPRPPVPVPPVLPPNPPERDDPTEPDGEPDWSDDELPPVVNSMDEPLPVRSSNLKLHIRH